MKKFVILIPVYNDWQSVFELLGKIDFEISKWDSEVSVLIVNDSSTEQRPKIKSNYKKIKSLKVINMKKNQGHARCNATGLKFLTDKENFDYVIIMDGDGEDRPEELNLIYKKINENPLKSITAIRVKRSEGSVFKFLYECHKLLTYVFTGRLIRFGNYSCLPNTDVIKLTKEASLWSSFSGAVTKTISDRMTIPSVRGSRYFGPSHMNFINLIIHSFSIIAVFKNTVLIRSILFSIFYLFFVFSNLSLITLTPFVIIFIFLFSIFKLSARENIGELNNSLENIYKIDDLSDFCNR